MKDYLVLLYGRGVHQENIEASEKMAHYQLWGAYLQPFNDDEKYLSGSPTRPIAQIRVEGVSKQERAQNGKKLEGFMVIRAADLEELYRKVKGNPILATEGAYLEIHELDPQLLISSKLPEA